MAAKDSREQEIPMDMESQSLSEQLQRVVCSRLGHGVCIVCTESLNKRKKKWRKRHKAVSVQKPTEDSVDPQQKSELQDVVSACWDLQTRLAHTRREGLETVKRLRIEKWDHCLQAIRYRVSKSQATVESFQQALDSPCPPSPTEHSTQEHPTILALQCAIAEAQAMRTVREMKLYETPRVPSISQEISIPTTQTIEEATQALTADPALSLHIDDNMDSNNNIPVVMTTEVSTTSLPNCDTAVQDEQALRTPVAFMPPDPLNPYLSDLASDYSQTSDSDAPLHVGRMEVVCTVGTVTVPEDSEVVMGSSTQQDNRADTPNVSKPLHTPRSRTPTTASKRPRSRTPTRRSSRISKSPAVLDEPLVVPPIENQPHIPSVGKNLPIDPAFGDNQSIEHPVAGNRISSDDEDSDSQMRKLLQVLERTTYNLRIPQKNSGETQRYSFENGVTVTAASVRKKRKRSRTPKKKL